MRCRVCNDVDVIISSPWNFAAPPFAFIRLVPKTYCFAIKEVWHSTNGELGTIVALDPPGDLHRHRSIFAGANHIAVMRLTTDKTIDRRWTSQSFLGRCILLRADNICGER